LDKKIVVTGGAGFIGSHVVDVLANDGNEVHVIDDYSGAYRGKFENNLAVYNDVSVASKEAHELISSIEPNEIWHLAANAREGGSWFQPKNIVERNSYGFINILEAAISGGKLDKCILFSSMSVYGSETPPFTEDMTPQPENPYAVSKYAAEQYLRLLSPLYDFSWLVIRPHNVFGERVYRHDKIRNVIAIFCNQILLGEPIYIYGDGKHTRAHSYIYDCIGPIMRAGSEINNEVINIGGNKNYTIYETADLVRKAMGQPDWEIVFLPKRYREVPDAYCDHKKAENLLSFKEHIGADSGIQLVSEAFMYEGPVQYKDNEPLVLNHKLIPKTWK